ncbi:polysaccharide deacetylase family protein [Azospirillum sp. ST 5-10]|uniref:polysaccharide deacetylase family protein n=1 Tax=unclassified Azospirillum TaxID=2630922 RepID=UPI003F49E4D2
MFDAPIPPPGMRSPSPVATPLSVPFHGRRRGTALILGALAALLAFGGVRAEEPRPTAATLQLGLFADEGSAWWAWQKLQRGEPALAKELSPRVVPLGAEPRSGVALRAALGAGVDASALCRRMVGEGFGCLVLDGPPAPAPAAEPPGSSGPIAFAPLPQTKPEPPADAAAAEAAVERPTPSLAIPPVLPAATRPLADAAMPTTEGTFFYTPDEARELAEIEKRSRRLGGRLGAVLPDTKFDVAPAVLKRAEWNLCALTFDDGPHRIHTPKILEILNREKVRATYFPIARVAAKHPEIIKAFLAAGHEVGSHSLTHANLRPMPAAAQRFEIVEANRILRGMGANPVLFRPPYGRYTQELLSIIRNEGMVPVLWNVDTRDWQVRDPDKIVEHVKTADGTASVLLMHSTYPTSASALPGVIEGLRAKGCEFVTLSEWIEKMRTVATPMMADEPVVSANVPLTGTARP